MDYALFVLNPKGVVKTFQNGEELGYKTEEIEGESFSNLYTKRAQQENPIKDNLGKASTEGELHIEEVIVRKDGSEFEARITIQPINQDGETPLFIVIIKDTDGGENLDDFSGLVSHELRNSLGIAQGYLKMAREEGKESDFEEVKQAHENMITTITDLVMVTTNGDIEKEIVNLKDVFEEAYSYSDHEKTSYEAENVEIKAGRSSLMRLLGNLISNSVKHNKGQVYIEVGLLEGDNGFYYQDDGQGILKENREKALKRGYTTSEEEGQGLGLYLMKRLADLNGWNVKLKESDSGGARFEIYIEE